MEERLEPAVDELVDRLTLRAGRLEPGRVPGERAVGAPDVRRVLVAVDGSPSSLHAAAWAREVARAFRARAWPMTATMPPDVVERYLDALASLMVPGPSNLMRDEEERALDLLRSTQRVLGDAAADEVVLRQGPAPPAIAAAAHDARADLVVVGSRGLGGAGRLLLGSVADAVRRRVEASVLIARNEPPPDRILAPVDGSRASKVAASLALALGRAWNVPVTVFYAFEPLMYDTAEQVERRFRQALEGVRPAWREPRTALDVGFGPPAHAILDAVEHGGYGLVVLGSRGLGQSPPILGGSVSNRVAHGADASVLVVKEPGPA